MKTSASIFALLSLALAFPTATFAKDTVHASRGSITLPTYPWTAVKHPYFRGTDRVNIYPYPMLDFLSRDPTNRTYQTVVLENEYLRITFLPELGGKIHEVIDKTTGQPMFYVNHVIKPALIGQAGAWTSGGVEWNTGPQGHTVGCMQPVDVIILPREKDGSLSVAVGETERIYGTKWTVVVTLRPGRSFIEERIRIYNPTETIRPYYFWNCTAAPNTKGFRFIYPMTLGTDHGAEKFFHWPVNEGKDLSRGTNYQDASSIFAWHCDQDFFGSYNDDLDRGVVAYANHHQLPGKKAWTWGWGSYGTMHQMDLTDNDGPYNEVQTGPLLTQGEVGRLDPCEAVEWQEWWYPIQSIGGFTFANRDVAANASFEGDHLRLRLLGTGKWSPVDVRILKATNQVGQTQSDLSADKPTDLRFAVGGAAEPLWVELWAGARLITQFDDNGVATLVPAEPSAGRRLLARFRVPLELPKREPPEAKPKAETASEFAQAGWQEFLFARFPEAEANFRKALEQDPKCVEAHTGIAHLNLDRDPRAAADAARAALAVNPNDGEARFALAVAEYRLGEEQAALDDAWKASLDPARAIAGRALVATILIRQQSYAKAVEALSWNGPWVNDPSCQDLLAVACLAVHEPEAGRRAALTALEIDPLDWVAFKVLESQKLPANNDERRNPALHPVQLQGARFPYQSEQELALRQALERRPDDGPSALDLGHLLFHLGRHAEGRAMWQKAAELGAEPVIAYRALGMSSKTLDNDLKSAREWLEKANQADLRDAIVARDLANVLFALADQAGSDAEKRALTTEARDRLQGAFEGGKGRSDFVALLARSHSRLGESAQTAKLLDSVRITIWEGAHEAHDLFEEAHLVLGEAQLKAGHPAEALAEFNRALEYPKNLATGRLENACDAQIHYQRGMALAALGRKDEARAAWRQAVAEPASKDAKKEAARENARAALVKLG
jgi:tetratricopeptide (TPR) repeat protein